MNKEQALNLSIIGVLKGALAETSEHIKQLTVSLLLPATALALLGTFKHDIAAAIIISDVGFGLRGAKLLPVLVSGLFFVMYASTIHRVIVVPGERLPNRYGIYWTVRELKYFGYLAILTLASYPVLALASFAIELAGSSLFRGNTLATVSGALIVIVLVFYVLARASLALPAIAAGNYPGFRKSWVLSQRNGWRLTIALTVSLVCVGVATAIISQAFKLSGFYGRISSILLALSEWVFYIFVLAVLSTAFSRLNSSQ